MTTMQAHDIPGMVGYLLEKHGLFQKGWRFSWDNARRRCGCCRYLRKKITLSRHYVQLNVVNNLHDVIDTILHEIAHALVGPGHGHNAIWQAMCLKVGARPKRCADDNIVVTPAKYLARCSSCGKEYRRHRVNRGRAYYCAPCGLPRGKLVFSSREVSAPAPPPAQPPIDFATQPRKLRGT